VNFVFLLKKAFAFRRWSISKTIWYCQSWLFFHIRKIEYFSPNILLVLFKQISIYFLLKFLILF